MSPTNPHQVTRDFEAALCAYTGAPHAVVVNSCTAALMLAVAWHFRNEYAYMQMWGERPQISIPKRTYVSVPMAIIHAGGRPVFTDEEWTGCYRLEPLPVWDCARYFTGGMYHGRVQNVRGTIRLESNCSSSFLCVSFHASKTLGDTQGGAILHDNAEADAWFRRARFDGRAEGVAPKDDKGIIVGYHCYISPDVSARLLMKLTAANFPRHNEPLPNDEYPDLSTLECFR